MATISITHFKTSSLHLNFNQITQIEISDKPFAEGGFGELYHCLAIDGTPPQVPQVIKILKDDGSNNAATCFSTVQKLQEKIISENENRKRQGEVTIENIPALFALPQLSYQGTLRGKTILGYSANKINTHEYIEFEDILQEYNLQQQYYQLPLSQKLRSALDLVEGVNILRDMSFIHADINGQNLFISLQTGHLIIIDYDSGAVTENPNDSPTTWGKPNEWLAPEIAHQLAQLQSGIHTVNVNLFTDTWSVAVGIHYLIFLRHPLFYLNRLGIKDMQDYFSRYQWPDVDIQSPNFNRSVQTTYSKITALLSSDPQIADIKKRLAVTINDGFHKPSRRTTYGQWVHTLNKSTTHQPITPVNIIHTQSPPSQQHSIIVTQQVQPKIVRPVASPQPQRVRVPQQQQAQAPIQRRVQMPNIRQPPLSRPKKSRIIPKFFIGAIIGMILIVFLRNSFQNQFISAMYTTDNRVIPDRTTVEDLTAFQNAIVLFNDSFTDNTNDWYEINDSQFLMRVNDGAYQLSNRTENGFWWLTCQTVNINQNKDFMIEAVIQKLEGLNDSGYGIAWGVEPGEWNNQYRFIINGNGKYKFSKYIRGEFFDIIAWKESPNIRLHDSKNKITIRRSGSKLVFFINDSYVDEAKFESFFGNNLGFVVDDKLEVQIENLMIKQVS